MSVGKYKVGDKVLIRDDLEIDRYYDEVYFNDMMNELKGKILIIRSINSAYCNGFYNVEESPWSYNDEMIVGKVEEDVEFTKDDLKTGMICTDVGGREWVVLRNIESLDKQSDIMIRNGSWSLLADANEDLTSTFDKNHDIVKVEVGYGYDTEGVLLNEWKGKRKVIWERDSKLKQAKQLLAEHYGKPIENIMIVVQ